MTRPTPPALSALQDPLHALRHLLPPALHAGGGPIALLQRPLPAAERAALTRARGPRLSDFTAGRSAARDALSDCGLPQAVLPQSKSGPPVWPAGFTGSISHARGWALAVCGPCTDVAALGLDIETLAADLDLFTIATRTECTQSADYLPARIFSAKEAVYKAQFPLTGRMLDFPEVEIAFDPAKRGYSRDTGTLTVTSFAATLHPAKGQTGCTTLRGLQVIALDMVISLVIIPASDTPLQAAPLLAKDAQGLLHRSRAMWSKLAGQWDKTGR